MKDEAVRRTRSWLTAIKNEVYLGAKCQYLCVSRATMILGVSFLSFLTWAIGTVFLVGLLAPFVGHTLAHPSGHLLSGESKGMSVFGAIGLLILFVVSITALLVVSIVQLILLLGDIALSTRYRKYGQSIYQRIGDIITVQKFLSGIANS